MSQVSVAYELAKELANKNNIAFDSSIIKNSDFKQLVAKAMLSKFKLGEIKTKKIGSEEDMLKYFYSVVSNTLTKDKRLNPTNVRIRLRKVK